MRSDGVRVVWHREEKYFNVKYKEGDLNADLIRAFFPRDPKMVCVSIFMSIQYGSYPFSHLGYSCKSVLGRSVQHGLSSEAFSVHFGAESCAAASPFIVIFLYLASTSHFSFLQESCLKGKFLMSI